MPNWNRRATAAAAQVRALFRQTGFLEQSVLDLVREEANGLRGKLGRGSTQARRVFARSLSVDCEVQFLEARHQEEVLDALTPGPSKMVLPKELPAEGLPIYRVTQPLSRDPEKHGE